MPQVVGLPACMHVCGYAAPCCLSDLTTLLCAHRASALTLCWTFKAPAHNHQLPQQCCHSVQVYCRYTAAAAAACRLRPSLLQDGLTAPLPHPAWERVRRKHLAVTALHNRPLPDPDITGAYALVTRRLPYCALAAIRGWEETALYL